jgi:hypothetical protein
MSVTLTALDSRPVAPFTGRVSVDGTFNTVGYPPGRYLVNVAAPAGTEYFFRSATYSGRDLSDEPLEIAGSEIGGIVIVFTDRQTEISGTVTNAKGQPDTEADVLIFPANQESWKEFGPNPRRSRSLRTSKTGMYQLAGLVPGEYYIAAAGSTTSGDFQDPRYLETLIKIATRITLADGEKKVQDLRTGQAR